MKVKVGNKIYDPEKEPMMLIFESEHDRMRIITHLVGMEETAKTYCMFPDTMSKKDAEEFMKSI